MHDKTGERCRQRQTFGISWDEVQETVEDRKSCWRSRVIQWFFSVGWTKVLGQGHTWVQVPMSLVQVIDGVKKAVCSCVPENATLYVGTSEPSITGVKVKGNVDHAPQESVGGCSSPSSRPWARRWRTTNVCDAWPVTYSYLPRHKASMPIGWYQIILYYTSISFKGWFSVNFCLNSQMFASSNAHKFAVLYIW